jgi:alpha-N-acetylglucosaminidase
MGNLDEFAGPQPANWRNDRFELQKKIVQRMRSLGIVPVLTAFAGHIPRALEDVYLKKVRLFFFVFPCFEISIFWWE